MQRGREHDRRQLGTSGTGTTGGDAPCIVFALATGNGPADSVIPAVQNLMLAARAIGIGPVPTTLHPAVMDRFHALFQIPRDVAFHFCVPLGYPQGNFGPNGRKPTSETTFLNRWGAAVPWESGICSANWPCRGPGCVGVRHLSRLGLRSPRPTRTTATPAMVTPVLRRLRGGDASALCLDCHHTIRLVAGSDLSVRRTLIVFGHRAMQLG